MNGFVIAFPTIPPLLAADFVGTPDTTYCAEITLLPFSQQVDSQFFWAGVPWEFETRQFTALTLNKGFKTTTYYPNNTVQ
jgi:hypothetical protein